MNKLYFLLLTFICLLGAVPAISGQAVEKPAPPTIEVTGSAETFVTPNEFTFKITLRERIENKQKVTIDQQETRLKEELAKIGIDTQKELTVFDLRSNYVPVRKRNRDVLGAKDYRLKVYDLDKVDRLQELAEPPTPNWSACAARPKWKPLRPPKLKPIICSAPSAKVPVRLYL